MAMLDQQIGSSVHAIAMHEQDNVATALAELKSGQCITVKIEERCIQLTLRDHIPFGHKLAITALQPHVEVRKYGEVIGRATTDIAEGQHVHVHNLEGIRGRGDQAKREGGV